MNENQFDFKKLSIRIINATKNEKIVAVISGPFSTVKEFADAGLYCDNILNDRMLKEQPIWLPVGQYLERFKIQITDPEDLTFKGIREQIIRADFHVKNIIIKANKQEAFDGDIKIIKPSKSGFDISKIVINDHKDIFQCNQLEVQISEQFFLDSETILMVTIPEYSELVMTLCN